MLTKKAHCVRFSFRELFIIVTVSLISDFLKTFILSETQVWGRKRFGNGALVTVCLLRAPRILRLPPKRRPLLE